MNVIYFVKEQKYFNNQTKDGEIKDYVNKPLHEVITLGEST